jgi:adenylosuccinate synthase
MDEAVATTIRERAGEFGSVTGRPRRIGWLDLPMLRHAARVNGYTGLALNHVDVLAELDELRVCERYERDGAVRETVPPTSAAWAACVPRYRRFDSWPDRDWTAIAERGYDALPPNAKRYVEYVADAVGVPVYTIGLGPDRDAVIELVDPLDPSSVDSRRATDPPN